MIQHTESPVVVGNDLLDCVEESVAVTPEPRKIPVAYEEVNLTEEAALILENARQPMAAQPPDEIRRMGVGDPARFRS